MKVIKSTHNLEEAKIIASFLNAHGVDAELLDANFNSMLSVLPDGIRIAVPEQQEAEAMRLLAQAEAGVMRADDSPK